jgi:hypothetical protein
LAHTRKEDPWIKEASIEDIDKATAFLGLCIKALAEELVSESVGDWLSSIKATDDFILLENLFSSTEASTSSDQASSASIRQVSSHESNGPQKNFLTTFKKKVENLLQVREATKVSDLVTVPAVNASKPLKVLKVDLGLYFATTKAYGIPDPYLAGLKAAVNWSTMYDGKLLPACGVTPTNRDDAFGSDDDDDSCVSMIPISEIEFESYVNGGGVAAAVTDDEYSFDHDVDNDAYDLLPMVTPEKH